MAASTSSENNSEQPAPSPPLLSRSRSGSSSTTAIAKGSALARGEACLPCRKKKLPACDKCLAMGRGSRCEYQDTKYLNAIAALENTVRLLQSRINELESTSIGGAAPSRMSLDRGIFTVPRSLTSLPLSSSPEEEVGLRLEWPYGPPHSQHPRGASNAPVFGDSSLKDLVSHLANDPMGQHAVDLDVSQSLLATFQLHVGQFFVPSSVSNRLVVSATPDANPLALSHSALREAAHAIGAHFSSLSQTPPHRGTTNGELEEQNPYRVMCAALVVRAESLVTSYAVQSPARDALHIVQALSLLGELQYIRGRPVDGHRLIGGALRLARALGLGCGPRSQDREEMHETWGMLQLVDWTWSGICRIACETALNMARADQVSPTIVRLPSVVPAGQVIDQETFDALPCHSRARALHAHVHMLLLFPPAERGPEFWDLRFAPAVGSLERLSAESNLASNWPARETKIIAEGALLLLNAAVGFADLASASASGVALLVQGQIEARQDQHFDWTTIDPLAAFYLVHVEKTLLASSRTRTHSASPAGLPAVAQVLDVIVPSMPFLDTIRLHSS
ncbi:hypothetical protein BKA62DRAFT_722032 [Auriculariales sp. MPI-PUGE-AT-0066]|nr:hypothetical protein BKA62DRAFT_722032 [Auriculariales sp. MPI-PUGE-AT-0066]